jgi:K+-transporting ATPase KdpF subunit
MDWTTILALLVTIGLVGYLTIALLLPERFS